MDRPYRPPTNGEKKAHFELFNQEGFHKYLGLLYRLEELERVVEQLTTVEPTQIVPTTEEEWGAAAAIYLATRPSSQSGQVDTKSGPVEHNSECVHEWRSNLEPATELRLIGNGIRPGVSWCKNCGALMWLDKILVPAVRRTSSTSPKQPSKRYVEPSVEESATSLSRGWWTNGYKQVYGQGLGTWHWHSGHSHEGNADRWHQHEYTSGD